MNKHFTPQCVRNSLLALAATFLFSACGGGGSAPSSAAPPVAQASQGTIIILLTDAPVDDLSAMYLDVTEATLISDAGHQTLFSGNETIDLLNLANFEQPIVFGEVDAGHFTKMRLRIENIELVDRFTGESSFPNLPANGKIDLLDQDGFDVFPGRTLIVEIDIDANKSIHVVNTGNSKYQVRPVVKVNIMDGGLPAKLVRLEGIVDEIFDDPAGRFRLCHADNADSCVIVNLADGGSVFGHDGQPVGFETLMVNDSVVAIGVFRHADSGVELDAAVIEIGGNASQVRGIVLGQPDDDGRFELGVGPDINMTVQLQDGTKFFGEDGSLGPEALEVGKKILVEGVVETSDDPDLDDLIRAALVFVNGVENGESLSGTLAEPLDEMNMSFNLATDGGDVCVQLNDDARIFLVSQDDMDGTVIEEGMFSDLESGQAAEVFGESDAAGCFQASEVVIDLTVAL